MELKILLLFVPLSVAQFFGLDQISKANDYFANRMYQQLTGKSENVFFSPLSAHAVLSLVAQGAAGETLQEFNRVLRVTSITSAAGYQSLMNVLRTTNNVTLDMANKIYVQQNYKIKKHFKTVASNNFLAEAESINFGDNQKAAQNINGWCSRMTHNKIKDMVSSKDLSDLPSMILLNAVYFKGLWDVPFDKRKTAKAPFYVNKRETISVDMMNSENDRFHYDFKQDLDASILELKYQNKDISMIIVLPRDRYGIEALEKKMVNYDLSRITLGSVPVQVSVRMPKFKIESQMQLKEVLLNMGISKGFGREADFSNLLDSQKQLKITKAIQKAFIDVNEEGTEASAATAAKIYPKSWTPAVEINHPFIVLIQIKTVQSRITLFYGRILRPNTK